MERLQEIIAKLESYKFECEAGPLNLCTDWEALKQLAAERDTLHAHPEKVLAVDHNHTTGKVRGLLCRRCNSTIGFMNDNTKTVQAAADYLARCQ